MPDSISKDSAAARVVTIIQARMGSERLPGKVLAPILGTPLLALIIKRISVSRMGGPVVVATTREPEDDAVAELVLRLGVNCFRGATEDCLDRYYEAARNCQAEVVVRLTADNPLIDHEFLDWVVSEFFATDPRCDYLITSSTSFPLGLSVEVFSFSALEVAWRETLDPDLRAHVTPHLRRHPERFRGVTLTGSRDCSQMRWTVDTHEDLKFVRALFDHFGHDHFSWREAIAAVEAHPEWTEINRNVRQRSQ